jgi:hypothetical protein
MNVDKSNGLIHLQSTLNVLMNKKNFLKINNSNEYLVKQDNFDDKIKNDETNLLVKQYGGDSLIKNKMKIESIVDYSEVDNIVKCVEHLKGSLDLDDIDESDYPSIESFNETVHQLIIKVVSLVDVFQYTGLRDIATIFRINKYCVKVIKDSKFYLIYFFKKDRNYVIKKEKEFFYSIGYRFPFDKYRMIAYTVLNILETKVNKNFNSNLIFYISKQIQLQDCKEFCEPKKYYEINGYFYDEFNRKLGVTIYEDKLNEKETVEIIQFPNNSIRILGKIECIRPNSFLTKGHQKSVTNIDDCIDDFDF